MLSTGANVGTLTHEVHSSADGLHMNPLLQLTQSSSSTTPSSTMKPPGPLCVRANASSCACVSAYARVCEGVRGRAKKKASQSKEHQRRFNGTYLKLRLRSLLCIFRTRLYVFPLTTFVAKDKGCGVWSWGSAIALYCN